MLIDTLKPLQMIKEMTGSFSFRIGNMSRANQERERAWILRWIRLYGIAIEQRSRRGFEGIKTM